GLSGTGSLPKTGTGTLSLTGANDYAGSTTVSGGTLSVEGGGSITSTPTLTVAGTDARLRVDGVGSSSTISNTALIGSAAEAGELIITDAAGAVVRWMKRAAWERVGVSPSITRRPRHRTAAAISTES